MTTIEIFEIKVSGRSASTRFFINIFRFRAFRFGWYMYKKDKKKYFLFFLSAKGAEGSELSRHVRLKVDFFMTPSYLPPPPLCLNGHKSRNASFLSPCINITCYWNEKGLKRMILQYKIIWLRRKNRSRNFNIPINNEKFSFSTSRHTYKTKFWKFLCLFLRF